MSENQSHIIVGTAGHIDHGKTALVKTLTGINCDRLDEEKRRGITIELGFAPWTLPPTAPGQASLQASIIDVPGHERLVRTMVAGAAGMDLAMLVIAADDGVMPQTREHLDVLRLLDVPAGIVVLTKCDLMDSDPELIDLIEEDIRAAIAGSLFESAPLIRTSSKTGMGIDAVCEAVRTTAQTLRVRDNEGPVFLPIDRVFNKTGYGTVVTGTTLRGTLRVGEELEAWSDASAPIEQLKIRGMQALGNEASTVWAGMRTAVNLAGRGTESIKRGMVLASPDAFMAVDACVSWVDTLEDIKPIGDEVLTVHLGTSERQARVLPLNQSELAPASAGGILLRFDRPIATYTGQRLVLRRPGVHGQATVAGGEVLDPHPPKGKGAVSLAASQIDALRGG